MGKNEDLKNVIESNQNFVIYTHINTDGDALGSSFGFYRVLKQLGKNVDLFIDSPVPSSLSFLGIEEVLNKKTISKYDVVFSLDSGESDRLGKYEKDFYAVPNSVQIDHHRNNPNFAKLNFVSPDTSSTCEYIYKLIGEMGYKIDEKTAVCFLTGIMTDTGGLRFSNATKETLFTVYDIVAKYNIDLSEIMSQIFETMDQETFVTYKYAINNTKFFDENKIAMIIVDNKFLTGNNIPLSATKMLTRIGTEIKDVFYTVAIVEEKPNEYKVSFRGRKGKSVESCARALGGGGHLYAAGCKLYGNIETVKEKILKAIRDEM